MKKFFGTLAWILGIPAFIVIIFLIFGYCALKFNFWPPNCNSIPIKQARQVCEFSKLDKAPKGHPAKITFWVTVPFTTPTSDTVLLAIKGKDPVKMNRVNATTFQIILDLTTGDRLDYIYLRNSASSTSDDKQYIVKSFEKTIYDYVSVWSDLNMPRISKSLSPAVGMIDTWSINYNMQFFEDTRNNLDSTMARIKAIGGKEIGIYTLVEMFGNKDNFVVQEVAPMPTNIWGELHSKYMRDSSITENEMKKIVKIAKKYDLKTIIYYNIEADYTQYYDITLNPYSARGSGGNTSEDRAGTDFGRYDPKTKEWLDRYFSQLKTVLVALATRADKAGIYAIDISPRYKPPTVDPLQEYADTKWLDIITAVRGVYKGKIYADGNPTFRNSVDALSYPVNIKVRSGASIAEMRQGWATTLNNAQAELGSYNKPVFLSVRTASFDGATTGKGGMEFADYEEVAQRGYKRNWQEQADAYEAFFQEIIGKTFFEGFDTHYFAWDDLMGPEYTPVRYNDLAANIRNKPAEAVWKKWVLPIK